MRAWTFENTADMAQIVRAKQACLDAVAVPRQYPVTFMTLHGAYGVGKTHLLAATLNQVRSYGVQGYYSTVQSLLNAMTNLFATDAKARRAGYGGGAADLFRGWLYQVPVLALDELTRYQSTEWSQAFLENLVQERYRPGSLYTLFAFNGEMSILTPYLLSRLSDKRFARVERIVGKDVRTLA